MLPKILFILHLPPPVHGSSMVGQYIHDSQRINNTFRTRFVNLGTSKSVDEIGEKSFKKYVTYFKILKEIFKILKNDRPDKVYLAITAKGIALYKDCFVVSLVKFFKVPLIIHFHNKGVNKYQDKIIDNQLYKFVFKDSKIILLSHCLYTDIARYVDKKDVYYCPNGIPYFSTEEVKSQKNSKMINLLFLSNLIASKGVYELIEACNLLKERNHKFTCTIIGGEGDVSREQLQDKIKEFNLQEEVSYLGKRYGAEKEDAFSKADVFVFPTFYHNECFPLVLLEAMQFGLPVVSTNEGGIPDIIEEGTTGYIVTKNDVEMLTDRIELFIKRPELVLEMGAKAKKIFYEKYTLETFENRLTKILEIA
ncbi:glycosyltransferase family 4 protein [Aquimarina sp. ERC-38]|uniref:glycosyltransferase family 4 protein n=1 Tax=Aquimarina sp. ERC-38 TaxID=2949996 RepID=UPI002245B30A|nr:glycosyltransferase family 4 protein [Aquimarina sp. ERC-38]UZO81460.1 glycosyltransferase family 4 protein [Aquimarina sp. ERC-38]